MRHRSQLLCRAVLIILILLAAMTSAAQDQNYQIRTRVELVVVPITVKSSGDQLVAGLTKKDFRVFENGKEQTISNFTIDPAPLSAAILVDTGLTARSFERVQETLPALTGAFSSFDEVAVYRFDGYVAKLTDFTSNKEVLEAALNQLNQFQPETASVAGPNTPFSTFGPVINGNPVAPSLQPPSPAPPKDVKVLNDAMFTAASDLAKRPADHRRILIVMSDGRSGGNDRSYDQALTQLLENNVQVYSIGMDLAFLARRFSPLDKYAKASGGDTFFLDATHTLEWSYTRAAEEARNQYVLGYFSTNKAPGPLPVFRKISVQTLRPGLAVLHRSGYYQFP